MPRMNSLSQSPLSSSPTPYNATNYDQESAPQSTFSKISPILLLVIIIISVLVFIYGLLHLLVRVLMKRPSFSAVYQSNRYTSETTGSNTHAFQRQLQQLFKWHDSGLDQTFVDALPVFYYKDIVGLKEPFDCAICLSEFCYNDKLRLLPRCSHAFHIHCIDTWLLSNSTCPLCRGSLWSPRGPKLEESQVFSSITFPSERKDGFLGDDSKCSRIQEIDACKMRLISVRLGKFKRLNNEGCKDRGHQGETSSSNLDARRCYSMGAFQYVEVDSDLQVALKNARLFGSTTDSNGDILDDDEIAKEGNKICGRTRGESVSVSKIWLWSKKSRTESVASTLQTNDRIESFVNIL